jgi:hypothetical protein
VLHWGCADVNQVKNLLLLHKTIAAMLDFAATHPHILGKIHLPYSIS